METVLKVKTNRAIKGGNDGKPLDGVWICSQCDNLEAQEREVTCWYCELGEMIYFDRSTLAEIAHKSGVNQ